MNTRIAKCSLRDLGWDLEHVDKSCVGMRVDTILVDQGNHDGGGGVWNFGVDNVGDGFLGGGGVDGNEPVVDKFSDLIDAVDCVPAVYRRVSTWLCGGGRMIGVRPGFDAGETCPTISSST